MFSLIRKFKLLLLHVHKKNKNNPCREKNYLRNRKTPIKLVTSYSKNNRNKNSLKTIQIQFIIFVAFLYKISKIKKLIMIISEVYKVISQDNQRKSIKI